MINFGVLAASGSSKSGLTQNVRVLAAWSSLATSRVVLKLATGIFESSILKLLLSFLTAPVARVLGHPQEEPLGIAVVQTDAAERAGGGRGRADAHQRGDINRRAGDRGCELAE